MQNQELKLFLQLYLHLASCHRILLGWNIWNYPFLMFLTHIPTLVLCIRYFSSAPPGVLSILLHLTLRPVGLTFMVRMDEIPHFLVSGWVCPMAATEKWAGRMKGEISLAPALSLSQIAFSYTQRPHSHSPVFTMLSLIQSFSTLTLLISWARYNTLLYASV